MIQIYMKDAKQAERARSSFLAEAGRNQVFNMFIAFGILSILAGLFVFSQGTALSFLSGLANSQGASATSGAFLIVAICLIIAGAFSCASNHGEKHGTVIVSIICYAFAAISAFTFSVGDLRIWSWVCLILAVVYFIWLLTHRSKKE